MTISDVVPRLTLIVGLTFALVPCGAAAGTGQLEVVHPTVDVCALLSEKTATALLGDGVAVSQSSDPAVECHWSAKGTSVDAQAPSIGITIEWPGPTEVERLAHSPNLGMTSGSTQRVTDLPAQAFWIESKRTLVVLSAGMRMDVSLAGPWVGPDMTSDLLRGRAVRAAREALMNLPP